MARIILGVTGSIAAYKAADLCSKLTQRGHELHVVMTEAATKLVSPHTFLYLSGSRVHTDMWSEDQVGPIEHIQLNDDADLIVIAPATANTLGQLAHGLAPDMLSTLVLAARTPVLLCPAMNPRMWSHPAVQSNLNRLTAMGFEVISPDAGHMACGHTGTGRLVEPAALVERIEARLAAPATAPGTGLARWVLRWEERLDAPLREADTRYWQSAALVELDEGLLDPSDGRPLGRLLILRAPGAAALERLIAASPATAAGRPPRLQATELGSAVEAAGES